VDFDSGMFINHTRGTRREYPPLADSLKEIVALGGNTGWLLADGTLSMIDIGNGQLRTSGQVSGLKGAVRDIAVLPAM
jgi:hypothetical protein